ncbi:MULTISPECIES: VOC family protein [unclassified Nonomuraea]|uniref:VOC family protein n=1 Tax=unclassified Nonomuraea TaxID=2593643 RepID=UPI00340D2A78
MRGRTRSARNVRQSSRSPSQASRYQRRPAYFERPGHDGEPAYVEFRVGDYRHELGIVRGAYAPHGVGAAPAGAVLYWAVDDLDATLDRLLAMGAEEHQGIVDRGGDGFVTASVVDPFGNVLGIMTNPHYLEVLGSARPS